ncbi:DNA polymerase/3'-5' exonuclease PolX [Olivibacter domesticus]|uniref:DNA polymerase (Family 10) n=1 Tax=Olivibacter domesticus TaxID=407022 RepID=A0A1H7LNC0_OLID1|nr:DNA polymerase/3'-5' exonuclease PolX [Olivibacter domesticus]SEL00431.1 DNA polymerase (family 10) [Olivibacter domesticus]
MENKIISRKLKLLSQLMELHGENSFKTKAVANASFKLDKLPFRIIDKTELELSEQQGIGKSTAAKVWELLNTGCIRELEDLLSRTPDGILEMLTIKGLGPKKIVIIWQTLNIETIGELYYACNENRLIEAKGFGLKTQEEIKRAIEFNMASQGFFLYSQAEKIATHVGKELEELLPKDCLLHITGDFRRRVEILSRIDFITTATEKELLNGIEHLASLIKFEQKDGHIQTIHESGLPIYFFISNNTTFQRDLLISTGNEDHLNLLKQKLDGDIPDGQDEKEIYRKAHLDFIEPELREGLDEIEKASHHTLPNLINYTDIKGTLHNHSTWSDGVHTLEEMARHCKETLKLGYLGICDHSRTAVYAKGLKDEQVLQQWLEIEELNKKLTPFKIFKGIESDILSDGSLDYPEELLKGFDFVVASIHSNLKMDEERATTRLIKAIENPYTTILGHPTGRLLLSRKGYPINFKKVIDACAANKVVMEINANPLRLDLDWRWHRYALEKGVLLSINPDAHRTEGLKDMYYGTLIGRKGGLEAVQCLNCFSLEEIDHYFKTRKLL